MKIKVENLGAIKQGEIDLSKNLILFTGPNNSGKSYMSYLVYGVLELLENGGLNDRMLENVTEKAEGYEKAKMVAEEDFDEDSKSFNSFVKLIYDILTEVSLEDKAKIFGASENLWNWIIEPNDKELFEDKNKKGTNSNSDVITTVVVVIIILVVLYLIFGSSSSSINEAEKKLEKSKPAFSKRNSNLNLIFFPAERTALTMVAKPIMKNKASEWDDFRRKIQHSKISEIKKEFRDELPHYPLAIADYIDWVNDLDQITRNTSEFQDLANEIEELMLKGKVSTSDFGNIRFTPPKAKKPLELHVSSSLVKSLSGLILYLRHQAKKHDVIMIDEPELNLHPDSQILVARALAKLVNAGFKLIVSTHSDYIIKEMNNLIMLHKQKENKKLIQSFDCTEDMLIDREDMSVYFFNNGTIKDLEIKETGVAIPTINSAIDTMNDRMEDIYYKIFEENEEMAGE